MTNQYLNGWKQEEIDYLRENYGKLFGKDIAYIVALSGLNLILL